MPSWTTLIQKDSEDYGIDVATRLMAKELFEEVTKRCTNWNEVGKMLPLLIRSKMDEWRSWKALVNEIAYLRARNQMLTVAQADKKAL